ncbi:uncharacterized protein [Battus philenor]|uniref:uncharacterized protein n=1 Tax=Battus philenor TaxID=42288 RepID=UPI0035D132BC
MKKVDTMKSVLDMEVGTNDCPFREFRDNELSVEYWGMGPATFKSTLRLGKGAVKAQGDHAWVDDQMQPLPRSARKRLYAWVRAEDLAQSLWEAEVTVFEDNNGGKMSLNDIQFAHYQVLQMSSFCRRVLSMCYILERVEDFSVEHQWENFVFALPPEGWCPRCHIYSPGLKYGGGAQHRPTLSRNGCYLVRLFYIGMWRCVWVSDQVPVDAADSPLLPFAPFFNQNTAKPIAAKQPIPNVPATPSVHLWPLLICKALLKLSAPGMDSDDETEDSEDEPMNEFDVLHALTGAMNLTYYFRDPDQLWKLLASEVPQFTWDDDDETVASTVKPKAKKPATKETAVFKRRSMTTIFIEDTKTLPPYALPGITPAFEMSLIITMVRDLPLKKPLPEPEVALWKHYRWIDWARSHGLYEAYDCPRTRFLKVNGLLKLSHAPHLLEVQSTDSITFGFREEHAKTNPVVKKDKGAKEAKGSGTTNPLVSPQMKEQLREWVQYHAIINVLRTTSLLYYPSMYQHSSIASNPPLRITKAPPNKQIDIPASKTTPLYLQIDCQEENILKISCGMLHPRVFLYCGQPIVDYIEPGYVLLERFEWFVDCEVPKGRLFLQTRGYDAAEVTFLPGRHFCRLWIHARVPWHVILLSDSAINVGTRDTIQVAAVRECPWVSRFLNTLGVAFQNLIRTNKSSTNITFVEKDFFRSYQPDLDWDPEEVGFVKNYLHWMFRQALQSTLKKKLPYSDFQSVCTVLQHFLYDPDFGLTKDLPPITYNRDWLVNELCDCSMLEGEELENFKMQYNDVMVEVTIDPITENICDVVAENLSCGHLKTIRDILLRRQEAAIRIQAFWRGFRARKCIQSRVVVTPEILKFLLDNAFGNLEALSALMNEFFSMYPGAKKAYSVASGLAGTFGLKQHIGSTKVTPQCVWIPYFQVIFYCHAPVLVHLDLQGMAGSMKVNSSIEVYNNDTKERLPLVYTAHSTLNIIPNDNGYTVIGHGTLLRPLNMPSEVHWQFTVMTSTANNFHVCDFDLLNGCKEMTVTSASKLHVDEIFIPNQRNILGGILITVLKQEIIGFRAAATSSELEMEAVLQIRGSDGKVEDVATCYGKGEIYWPFIRLDPVKRQSMTGPSISHVDMNLRSSDSRIRQRRNVKYGGNLSAGGGYCLLPDFNARPALEAVPESPECGIILNRVRAPQGWPLTLAQWKRVIEIQSNQDYKTESPNKKGVKDKKEKDKDKDKADALLFNKPQSGDAYVELECSLSGDTGAVAVRDDTRDQRFAAAVKSWDANEPGRNAKGALIRQEFREEYLEVPVEDVRSTEYSGLEEEIIDDNLLDQQGPTPVLHSPAHRGEVKIEEINLVTPESETQVEKFLTMPDELKDNFKPLDYVPLCTREKTESECVIITPEMAEASRLAREADTEAAIERMNQLQAYNEIHVLGMQKIRCNRLEKLYVDSQWSEGLAEAMEARDSAIAGEANSRSVTRKKQDSKTK